MLHLEGLGKNERWKCCLELENKLIKQNEKKREKMG